MTFAKFFRFLLFSIGLIFFNYAKAQHINVDTSLTADQLVQKFIGSQNSGCITVENVTVNGWDFGSGDFSFGYFNKNGSDLEVDQGIVLSTGRAKAAEGPNTYRQDNGGGSWEGDSDLANVFGGSAGNYKNATYLEFDFKSTKSTEISFQYIFLSEEYDKFKSATGCRYSDAFAFLIKPVGSLDPYTNIALVPGTSEPVSVINVRGYGGTCPARNENYFGNFFVESATSVAATNFNGQTKLLTATAQVEVGKLYHIKLVIADEGTTGHDSAVFLKSGSFTPKIDIGADRTIANKNPLCKDTPYRLQPNPPIDDTDAQYFWFKNGQALIVPVTQSYYDVINDEGSFSLSVVSPTGCQLQGDVVIEKTPTPQISTEQMMVCDNDFNGSYSAKLSSFDHQLIRDYDLGIFTRSYSLTPNGAAIDPNIQFEFTSNPQTLYLRVGAFACPATSQPIQFYFGTKLAIDKSKPSFNVCDTDRSGSETIQLTDYAGLLTSESGIISTFYNTEAEAKIGGASTVDFSQDFDAVNSSKTFFVRIEKSTACPEYAEFTLVYKLPRKSDLLPDGSPPIVICKNANTNLIAETNFDFYEWSNGVKGPLANKIENVGPGDYSVKLTSNGCVYEQFIKVIEAEEPIIDNILIEGSTVTILVSGGTLPYTFTLDNGASQTSNIFTNVELGTHTISVQGADGCSVVEKDFTLINSQSIITPNYDGMNDTINYSSLLQKLEPKFEVYDRYGVLVFKGDTSNQFIWNGTSNGRPLPTASYWYILEWNESGNPIRTQLSGWILLKNRN